MDGPLLIATVLQNRGKYLLFLLKLLLISRVIKRLSIGMFFSHGFGKILRWVYEFYIV